MHCNMTCRPARPSGVHTQDVVYSKPAQRVWAQQMYRSSALEGPGAHPEFAMDRLAAFRPRAYTLPEENGDEMPKLGDEKPL